MKRNTPEMTPEKLYEKGMALFREKRYAEAAPCLQRVCRESGGKHRLYGSLPRWPDAAAALAFMTERGEGVPANKVKARILYAQAGEAGSSEALREFLRLAAAEGLTNRGLLRHAAACARRLDETQAGGQLAARLADVCCYGKDGGPRDLPQAVSWYTTAWNWGNIGAAYCLGQLYRRGVREKDKCLLEADEDKALEWYERAARKGHLQAQLACAGVHADRCRHGRFRRGLDRAAFDENCERTLFWYEQAARQGDPFAMENCAEWYYWRDDHGRDTPASRQKALDWYGRLAGTLEPGAVTETLPKQAAALAAQSRSCAETMLRLPEAEAGDPQAQLAVGLLRHQKHDNAHALDWLEKAARQGVREAQLVAGLLHSLFFVPRADPLRGLSWLLAAAQQGDPLAQKLTGLMRRPDTGEYWPVEIHLAVRRLNERGELTQGDRAVLTRYGFGDDFYHEMLGTASGADRDAVPRKGGEPDGRRAED